MFFLKWRIKWRRFWVQCILWTSKIWFCFESRFNCYHFKWSYSQRCFDVPQRFKNLRWKWQRCWSQPWNKQRWFDLVQRRKFQRWRIQCFDFIRPRDQPKNNFETTLKCLLGVRSNIKKNGKTFQQIIVKIIDFVPRTKVYWARKRKADIVIHMDLTKRHYFLLKDAYSKSKDCASLDALSTIGE